MGARRGACPSLYAPMPTGDGLLVRMTVRSTLPLDVFEALCVAARRHGSGVMEISARGNLQIRGLTPPRVADFVADVIGLGIEPAGGTPIVIPPLAGLEDAEHLDVTPWAQALGAARLAARLHPKVSVVLDGAGRLHLDAVAGDVRLLADAGNWHIGLAGDAARAIPLGAIRDADPPDAILRLLNVIAARGLQARAHTVLAAEGLEPFRNAVGDLLVETEMPPPRPPCEPLDLHRLRDGKVAQGVGLAFGHADAAQLQAFTRQARRDGATGLRLAPGHALVVILDTPEGAVAMRAAAERAGLIGRADDPRRAIVACPGAPACRSGEIAARQWASAIAGAVPQLRGIARIHVSGCAKGCAHPRPAALTLVGRNGACGLVRNGQAQDVPSAFILPSALAAGVARDQPLLTAIDALLDDQARHD
jgi:precorrin-3B synthase